MHLTDTPTIIVAFDGIVADSLPLRAQALAEAIRSECGLDEQTLAAHELLPLMVGCSFSEAVGNAMVRCLSLQRSPCRTDITLHDIIAMRAQRRWASIAEYGVSLHDGVAVQLHREMSRGRRLVLRSDSQRREVEPVLRLANLEDSMLLVRCSDDLPRRVGVASLQASYEAIDARLDRLHIPRTQRCAVEASVETAGLALGYVATGRTSL